MFANELVDITHRTTENIYTCYFLKVCNECKSLQIQFSLQSLTYHDRMITMFSPLNIFSIEAEI